MGLTMGDAVMRLIRLKEVMHMTGLARSTVYKLMGDGAFPSSVPLQPRAVAWVESEVQDWIQLRLDMRGAELSAISKRASVPLRSVSCEN